MDGLIAALFNAQYIVGRAIWRSSPDVRIKNHGLGQYGAEPIILRYHFGNFVH